MKIRSIKSIANSVFAKLPVLGPHAGIEAELLLAGMKPLGWLSVWKNDDVNASNTHPDVIKEINDVKKLDQAVKEGKLRSYDVEFEQFTIPFKDSFKSISRHYSQPDKFHEMLEIASHNEDIFSRRKARTEIQKDYGEYLGYRQKDQYYWQKGWTAIIPESVLKSNFFQKSPLPKILNNASVFVNVHIAQPAYQADALRKAHKIIKEQAENKSTPAPLPKSKI